MLQDNNKMFDGTLAVFPHKRYILTLIQMLSLCIVVHNQYLVSMELDHLVRIDILTLQQESEWASPSFIIPKMDGRVRWISNLGQLN